MTERELQVFSDYRKDVFTLEFGAMAMMLDKDEIDRRPKEDQEKMASAVRAVGVLHVIDGLMEKCGYVPDPSPDGFGYVSAQAEGAEA